MINYLFIFFLVFMYGIGGIAISNIFYYFYASGNGVNLNKVYLYKSRFIFYLIFMCWASLSTFSYALFSGNFDGRSLLKYLFIFQYAILIIPIAVNKYKFELIVYRMVILLSIISSSLFFLLPIHNEGYFDSIEKSWAVGYIPGFPNSVPLILIFGLWISFRNNFSVFGKILIFFCLYLTSSRGAYVIAFFVTLYFIFAKYERFINIKLFISFVFAIVLSLFAAVFYADGIGFLGYFYDLDRLDIYQYSIKFIELRPIIGYGGNTLDQLHNVNVAYEPIFKWEHTHNWIFEVVLRYGLVGGLLFFLYLGAVFVSINSFELKFMFFVYIVYALSQTFMQNFIFIFILSYFANYFNINSRENSRAKFLSPHKKGLL